MRLNEEQQRNWRMEIVLKSFVDRDGKKYSLKNAREIVKSGISIYCMGKSSEGRVEITTAVKRFQSANIFETKDGNSYEIVDTENIPIKCDVIRYVNSKTEQETYHEAIVQKWLQENEHVTAFIVTQNGDAYRTSGILNVNWYTHIFLTKSGRRYSFS